MKNKICLALIAALGLSFVGCKTHEGAYEPLNTTAGQLESNERFVLMDPGAQRSVTLAGPIRERVDADGRLEVVAKVRNRENRRIEVQINCVFKDAQGFSTGDETPWQALILTENSQETVKFISSNGKSQRYTIRVRQAR